MHTSRCVSTMLLLLLSAGAPFAARPMPPAASAAPAPASPPTPPAKPADFQNGTIETTVPECRFELRGLDGLHTITVQTGKADIARGRYILMSWTVDRRDRRGHVWQATFAPAQYRWMEIGAEPARLELTTDLTAITTAEPHGTSAAMTLRFESGPWRLQSLTVDGVRPLEPMLRILDVHKQTIARVRCQYACCFTSRATWQTPLDLRGSFQVLPEADLGPFAIKTPAGAALTLSDRTAAMAQMPKAAVGTEAPDFSLPRIGGSSNLRPFWLRGKPLLLLFSCGCAPCQETAKRLAAAPELLRRIEMAVVVTNLPEATLESANRFREATGYRGPMLIDDGKVGAAYDALRCPKMWLLDAAGVARWTGGGVNDSRSPDDLVSEALHQLASLSPATASRTDAH